MGVRIFDDEGDAAAKIEVSAWFLRFVPKTGPKPPPEQFPRGPLGMGVE